jgi:FkbM family methyltransferase
MEHVRRKPTPVVQYIAGRIEKFTLIDVGCSGGLDAAWRDFGPRLQAFGFDPMAEEIERLTRLESNPQVKYIAGFVGRKSGAFWRRNHSDRLAYRRTAQIREKGQYTLPPVRDITQPPPLPPLGPSDDAIDLPDFFKSEGISDIDFIKIDVDGADYYILHSLKDCFRDMRVLGLMVEVNFFGSEEPDHHTFHNTDRFLRARGFDLFGLTVRLYSSAALPWPYVYPFPFPGPTLGGRPYQGDALYLRDFGWKLKEADPADYSPAKYAKLAALFALFNLPDQAAETILRFRPQLAEVLDVDEVLEMLAQQIQEGQPNPRSYADYVAAFDADSPEFYNRMNK